MPDNDISRRVKKILNLITSSSSANSTPTTSPSKVK